MPNLFNILQNSLMSPTQKWHKVTLGQIWSTPLDKSSLKAKPSNSLFDIWEYQTSPLAFDVLFFTFSFECLVSTLDKNRRTVLRFNLPVQWCRSNNFQQRLESIQTFGYQTEKAGGWLGWLTHCKFLASTDRMILFLCFG